MVRSFNAFGVLSCSTPALFLAFGVFSRAPRGFNCANAYGADGAAVRELVTSADLIRLTL